MLYTSKFSYFKAGIHKKLLIQKVEIGVVTLTLTLIVLTCVLAILLLLHSNSVATKGYELKMLRVDRHELSLMHERLEAKIAGKQSLNSVESSEFVDAQMTFIGKFVVLSRDTEVVMK